MNYIKLLIPFLFIKLLFSCGPIPDIREIQEIDLKPPVLNSIMSSDYNKVELNLDEEAYIPENSISIYPELEIIRIETYENNIVVFTETHIPGNKYTLNTVIIDENDNSAQILAVFYGYNPEIPVVKLNEFTTRGSSSHPDMVELKVFTDGNMGGIVIYHGTPDNYKDLLVFPSFSVKSGDFLIIHFKPQNITEEINETEEKDISGGLDASVNAYDFWIEDGSGLSGNNGAISIYERPGGPVVDGVLYSNRTSDSDEMYLGFGTRIAMEQALELSRDNGWISYNETICPEDAVSSDGSTSTRSICRNKNADSDTNSDWYIVPTRGYSFGSENLEEVYIP